MKIILFVLLLGGASSFSVDAQEKPQTKLVVGIVVDQMRYDYLEKFSPYFSENGFNKLKSNGYNFSNINYNYKPTYTGPGHASIFTGAPPSIHGIVGNNWYSRAEKNSVYCVELSADSSYILSPKRMLTESIADVVKSASSAKAYGVALKDRGAILPAGHHADGAYWFSSTTGKWESSRYYPNQFPTFLKQFNKTDFKSEALSQNWAMSPTLVGEEIAWFENDQTVKLQNFNHDLKMNFNEHEWDVLKAIPYGNQMTANFAMELIKAESLGKGDQLDFLSLSFSATDYVGHIYGVESPEVVDTYVKLDESLAGFIDFLDVEVGKGSYLLFLSSDHGADFSRKFLVEQSMPAGQLNLKEIKHELKTVLDKNFGAKDWIASMQNLNVYFNEKIKESLSAVEFKEVLTVAQNFLGTLEGVNQVINPTALNDSTTKLVQMVMNGYLKERSGELILIESPNWTTYSETGSTHGTPYNYDTHVPLLFYGEGVSNGQSNQPYNIIDIAPTVCHLLGIAPPKESIGNMATELLK